MSDAEPESVVPSSKNPSLLPYLLLAAAIVLVVGSVFYASGAKIGFQSPEDIAIPAETHVEPAKDYYVSVSLVELSEKDQNGVAWDSMSGSGPDIFVEIFWKGTRIYRSTTKDDTFIAKWSAGEINLRQAMLTGAKTSMDDLIQAARVNIRPTDELEVRVYDADLFEDTFVGAKTFRLDELLVGTHVYSFDGPGILRLGLRVNDMSQAVDMLK